MTNKISAQTAEQKRELLRRLVRDARLLDTARSIALPATALAAVVSAFAGPVAVAGTSLAAAAVVGGAGKYLARQKEKAFSLIEELHSMNELSEQEYLEGLRLLREATEETLAKKPA